MVFWIVIGVIVIVAIVFNFLASVSRDRTIQALAEKGQPIPPELLTGRRRDWDLRPYRVSRSPLRLGIILICVGIGIFLVSASPFWFENGAFHIEPSARFEVSSAVIPFMIGVAFVIIGLFDRRPPPSPPPT